MKKRKVAIAILSTIIIIALGSIFMANQIDNDTWDDTHWGGDVGEEKYNEPIEDEGTKGGGKLCSMVIMCVIVIPAYCFQWKRKEK